MSTTKTNATTALDVASRGCAALAKLLRDAAELDRTISELEKVPDYDDYAELWGSIKQCADRINHLMMAHPEVFSGTPAIDYPHE